MRREELLSGGNRVKEDLMDDAIKGLQHIVQLFLQAGADVDWIKDMDKTAVFYALREGHRDGFLRH